MNKSLKIPYIKENIIKCLCPTCPVQENSACTKEKMMNFQEILQGEENPKPQDYPGMYCANGKADCGDIDTDQNCVCPDCAVYKEHGLEKAVPDFLYCNDGRAKKK
ncbi:MAG TPA: DUF2769 domain-containing protein [Methanobacterium sp.]